MRYAAIFLLPLMGTQAIYLIGLPYNMVYGGQSKLLSDIALMLMAGYSVAFSFPMLFKYASLAWFAKNMGSRLCLVYFREDDALRKERLYLRILHDRPNLWW
jgi:hypothetical protein